MSDREERENALHCLKVMIDEEVCEECNLYGTTGTDHCEADCVRVAIKALEQESRKGHWKKIGDRGFGFSDTVICKCSECEYQTEFVGKFDGHNLIVDTERAYNYCPNCGADMREVEK